MSSFLKSIFHSSNKHKKLSEEWTSSREPVVDGVTFYVRYLGSSLVEDAKCAQSTTAGVKRVIHAAKAGARRPERVAFRVAMEGVRIDSTITGETIMDTSIYKISYCSADSQYEQILAFVASNEDDRCECHAFLCSKRKVAEAIAVSIAQAFTMAYECWKLAVEAKKNGETSLTSEEATDRGDTFSSRGGCSKGDGNSRSSSPEHSPGYSSPPSEVSSTSGYQSSTACGLLLELDYGDPSSGGLELSERTQQGQQSAEAARPREDWTSFDDVSELADEFVRLNLDPALNSFPTIACAAAATMPGSSQPESSGGCMQAQATLVQVLSKAADSASLDCEAIESALSLDTSAAAATPCHPTRSNSSSLLLTEEILGSNFSPTSQVGKSWPRPNQSYSTNCTRSHSNNYTDKKKVNSMNTQVFPSNWGASTNGLELLTFEDSFVSNSTKNTNSVDFADTIKADLNKGRLGYSAACGSVQTSRSDWESFDSSPPSQPVSPFGSLPSKCTLDLPVVSTLNSDPLCSKPSERHNELFSSDIGHTFTSSPGISGTSDAHHRVVSPTSAFLDSCLTPRFEGDNCERKFEFSSRLSSEEHNFSTNFNLAGLSDSSKAKISNLGNQAGTKWSKLEMVMNSDTASTIYSRDAIESVESEQKSFLELVR